MAAKLTTRKSQRRSHAAMREAGGTRPYKSAPSNLESRIEIIAQAVAEQVEGECRNAVRMIGYGATALGVM